MLWVVKFAGVGRRVGVHALRHSFSTLLMILGVDLCEIQKLQEHKNLEAARLNINIAKSYREL